SYLLLSFFFLNNLPISKIYTFPTRRSSDLKIVGSDGTVAGTYNAGSPINKAVLLVGNFVYVVTDSGQLHKVNSSTMSLAWGAARSEEHTSELQSQSNLVCRLLLEKKKQKNN